MFTVVNIMHVLPDKTNQYTFLEPVASIPLGAVAQFPPIQIPHAFLPPPSFRHSFYFPSPFLLSAPAFPLSRSLPCWIWARGYNPRKNLANLYVRTCILMCIVYVENSHWALCKTWIYRHYFCFGHYLKHLIQWIVMLFRILLMDRQLPRNFIALLQNWPDCRSLIRNTADKIEIQEKMNTKYKTQIKNSLKLAVRWGGSLSYWYLVLCYSWCELGRRVIASFVCNLIYLYGYFDSKIKIIWVWLLSLWCIFWLPNVCWCHITVSSYCIGYETYVEDCDL